MQKKSAYISSHLFYKLMTEHFIPCKPPGKVLLIVDGHSSHSSAVDMLETSQENDVILLCLPSHTTSALQPLDVSVFGPFKKYYYAETNNFIRTNPQKKLNLYNSGQLIAKAWIRAAIPVNAISGFRGSGIYPVNPNALSGTEFIMSDIALGEFAQEQEPEAKQSNTKQNCTPPRPSSSLSAFSQKCLALGDHEIENYILDGSALSLPSLISFNESQKKDLQKETPSKFLHASSPIPKIPLSKTAVRNQLKLFQ